MNLGMAKVEAEWIERTSLSTITLQGYSLFGGTAMNELFNFGVALFLVLLLSSQCNTKVLRDFAAAEVNQEFDVILSEKNNLLLRRWFQGGSIEMARFNEPPNSASLWYSILTLYRYDVVKIRTSPRRYYNNKNRLGVVLLLTPDTIHHHGIGNAYVSVSIAVTNSKY
jgi:hypothetical protein